MSEPAVVQRLLLGEPAALARAISVVENHRPGAQDILRAIRPHLGRARVVGVTGVPGAGKSTLVSRYVHELRSAKISVGVLAVDPSSPISGGAVLGDRIRMSEHATDSGVFVRSLASRGQVGGLAPTTTQAVDLMDAAGLERIIVETVGTGQDEVDIADAADLRVVVYAPELGDDVQALKAGILEIADVLVVNKGDLAGSSRAVGELEAMLALRAPESREVTVCKTTATTGEGVDELARVIETRLESIPPDRLRSEARVRRLLAAAAGNLLAHRLRHLKQDWLEELHGALQRGEMDLESAARAVLASKRLNDD